MLIINSMQAADLISDTLNYTSDAKPGYTRRKLKNAFYYYDDDGKKVSSPKVIERIDSLGIPPAWEEVWICRDKNGHIQAVGYDEKNRKQYIYHPEWIKLSQENKFARMVDFALNLPKIRNRISYELRQKDLDRERVLATAVWLLEHTFIRVGNEEYSRDNNSFGLTTLRNRHISVGRGEVTIKFRGKSGVTSIIEVDNPLIVKTIKECIELPGYELFQFIDDEGERHTVDSRDVNAYLRDLTENEFTAKDFRTWGATNLSAINLYRIGGADNEKIAKKNIVETVKKVAKHLNNTVSVCRSYYIHPTVINSYAKNILVPHFDTRAKNKKAKKGLSWNEFALVGLLKKYTS